MFDNKIDLLLLTLNFQTPHVQSLKIYIYVTGAKYKYIKILISKLRRIAHKTFLSEY